MTKSEQFKHDHYFRHAMKIPKVYIPFLTRHLPTALRQNLDVTRANPLDTELLNAKLNERFVDMLYIAPYKDQKAFIYVLVEHQSKGHPMMALRVVVYCLEIWSKLLSLRANALKELREKGTPIPDYLQFEKLPPIFPFIFYNGEKEWQPKSFLEKLENPSMFLELLHSPLRTVDAKKFDGVTWKNPWDRVFNMMMGSIYSKDIMQVFLEISEDLMHIEQEEGGEAFTKSTFTYLTTSAKHCDLHTLPEIIEKLGHQGGNYMTIVEQIRAEEYNRFADSLAQSAEDLKRERADKEKAKKQALAAKEQIRAAKELTRTAKEQARVAKEQSVINLLKSGINAETVASCMDLPLQQVQRLAEEHQLAL